MKVMLDASVNIHKTEWKDACLFKGQVETGVSSSAVGHVPEPKV